MHLKDSLVMIRSLFLVCKCILIIYLIVSVDLFLSQIMKV